MPETDSTSTDAVTGGQAPSTETVDSLPEWAREKLTKANNEAAKYRNEKNDAVNTAKAALTAEFEQKLSEKDTAYTELQGQLSAKSLELLKLQVALDLDIPSKKAVKFAALLSGTNEDEIKASAADAKDLFGAVEVKDRPTDPSQGSGNQSIPLNGDPILEAITRAVRA